MVFDEFKKLADKKKEIYDGDIAALIERLVHGHTAEEWSLARFEVACGTDARPRVSLTLKHGDRELREELSDGDGPIDCAFLAVEKITGIKLLCKDYQVRSATLGHDAQGEVLVEVEYHGETYRGRGASTDTVEATIQAILNAVNRIAGERKE